MDQGRWIYEYQLAQWTVGCLIKDDGRNDTAVTIDKIITGYEYMVQKAIKMDGFGQSRHEQMGIAVIDGDRDVFGEYGERNCDGELPAHTLTTHS